MVDSLLIISSNVGSLFEEKPKEIIQSWKNTLKNQINKKKPSVVIITLQEFAGKQIVPWSESYRFLEDLFDEFKTDYPRYLSTCDCDYDSDKYFTALCTIFMVRDDFEPIEFFDFDLNEFQTIKSGFYVHELSYERQKSLKIKFGIELFPNNKWSRKGYMINRVKVNGHVFDVVNLHLIHDLNFHALLETPKIYQNYRSLQLEEILRKLEEIESKKTILCGDFNFRTSILEIIKNYDPKFTIEKEVKHRSTNSLLHFKGADENQTIASLSATDIHLSDGLLPLDEARMRLHKKFDTELLEFEDRLMELPVDFLPTYCFSVNSEPSDYNSKRCPSWCDRIVFYGDFIRIVKQHQNRMKYESFARDLVVGDHKPISIHFPLDLLK